MIIDDVCIEHNEIKDIDTLKELLETGYLLLTITMKVTKSHKDDSKKYPRVVFVDEKHVNHQIIVVDEAYGYRYGFVINKGIEDYYTLKKEEKDGKTQYSLIKKEVI